MAATFALLCLGLWLGPYVKLCSKHVYYKLRPPRKRRVLEFEE